MPLLFVEVYGIKCKIKGKSVIWRTFTLGYIRWKDELNGDVQEVRFETERLFMRPYEIQDADSIFEVVKLRGIAETTISLPHPYPREHVDWWITFVKGKMEKGDAYEFAIFKKDRPSEYVGNCGFVSVSRQHNNAEIGYFISPSYWNNGYSTEACAKLIEFGFRGLGLERIYGRCMTKNIASKRVMEKCGLKVEGIAKHEVLKWNTYEDVIHFGLTRSEWDDL